MGRSMRRAGMRASLLALMCLGGCGGGGGSDEEPAPPVMLEGDDAVAASLRVVQSTMALLIGMRTEDAPFSSAGSSCSSGSINASCNIQNGQSVIDSAFAQCRLALTNGNALTADGGLRIQTSDPNACVTGRIPDTATVELEFRGFRQTLTSASGGELGRARTDGSDRIVPTGVGCAGRNVMEQIDATSDSTVNVRLPGKLAADGIDAEVRAQGLQMDQTSAGTPCERTMVVDGDMEVDDRANGIRYSQTLSGVTIRYTEADDAALIEIDGDIDNACVGAVTVTTVEPIRMRNATDCPTGGILHVTREGRTSEMRFGPGTSFSIDFGNRLVVGSDCRSIAQCSR